MGVLSKTTSEIEDALNNIDNIENTFNTMFTQKMLSIYPVGAIYMSASSTSPASLFGGTWEQIQDRFLLAAGSSYAAGATGGASTVTLTEAQLPYIEGTLIIHGQENGTCIYQTSGHFTGTQLDGKYKDSGNTVSSAYSQQNLKFSFGSGKSHTNMPPYLVVYVWKRTA